MDGVLIALGLAIAAGYGVVLCYTAAQFGWRGIGPGPGVAPIRSGLSDGDRLGPDQPRASPGRAGAASG